MRNLKKFLALVLAMMMTFSLMVTVNAATAASDFTDAESITGEFTEAIAVLEGLEVFEGYPDGTFKPKNNITRAEAATIVYRLATGDVKGNQAHLYKDYATFSDVKSDHWAAGYINYCANAQWIAGYGNGKFGPNDQVTGYQAAAMILRAVGYGKNNEFVGSGWQVQVANFSRSLGLLKNVNNTSYANTLNQAAPRELVAEILFQAGLIDTVTWTALTGYRPSGAVQGQTWDGRGLAWQNFKLNVANWTTIDKWGRPGYYWFKNTNTAANRVATIGIESDLDFNTAWKECDVAHELEIKTYDDFELYVNNYQSSTKAYRIESTDTVTNVGGQGRITEFYAVGDVEHPWEGLYNSTDKGDLGQRVVMIDTYLAKVTRVTERVLDRQGHVVTPAYLYLDVYDGHGVGPAADRGVFFAAGSAAKVNTTAHRLADKDANWAYVAGDMVLVRGYSDKEQWESATDAAAAAINYTKADGTSVGPFTNLTGLNHTGSQAAIEKSAFEPNCLMRSGSNYANDELAYNDVSGDATALEVVGKATTQKADMKTGKQTVTYWSQDKHTVDGTDYNDAMTLYLDVAGTTTGTTFAWYFDEFNNIIGIDNVPDTINYGVITSIYSSFGQGDSNTDGTSKAIANVLYADGSTGTLTIDKFLLGGTVTGTGWAGLTRKAPYAIMNGEAYTTGATPTAGNTLDLLPVYDNSTGNVMTTSGTRTGARTNNQGWLHVAPVTNVNAIENGQIGLVNGSYYFGVLRGNLFKFVASTDGNVTAVEVAGDGRNNNTGVYAGHGNNTADAGNGGKLFKNLGYIDLANTTGTTASVRLDTDAVVMIRASATSTSVACYSIDNLPGDVTLPAGSEVDWADTNGNGRANYVYVTGTSQGSLSYGLFYYNGGAAQWNGVDKTGTITGWLNGDPATLTFIGETTFTAVRDSQAYAGHLFAVEMTNGVVTSVMHKNAEAAANVRLLHDYGTGKPVLLSAPLTTFTNISKNGTAAFGIGTANGNPYTAATEATYIKDVTTVPVAADAEANVLYDPVAKVVYLDLDNSGSFTTGDTAYYLTLNSKVVGLGMGVNEENAILDYLNKSVANDVTIVYEQTNVKAIVEIYVATDPNVTPGTTDSSVLSLSYNQALRQFTVNFTNGTGVTLNNVVATVYYRVANSGNAWVPAGSTSPAAVLNGVPTSATFAFGAVGSTTNFEAYVSLTAINSVTGATYTLNTLSSLTYFIG